MRRSHNHAAGLGPLHMVSAFASEHGIALGQIAAEEKSNEITAIPKSIDRIDVEGAAVTIDAMGCQKEIAKKIKVEHKNVAWPAIYRGFVDLRSVC